MTASAPSTDLFPRSAPLCGVSKDGVGIWFETAQARLFTIRERLVGGGRQLTFFGIGCGAADVRLRDQTLQFRNARSAISAGFEPQTDFSSRTCTRGDGLADRGAADTETGADNRPSAGQSVHGFARQQHPALIVTQRIRSEQVFHHLPIARVTRGTDEQAGFDA